MNQIEEQAALAERYAEFADARAALGTVLIGLLALWPIWSEVLTHVFFGEANWAVRHWVQYKSIIFAPLFWACGRALVARWFYRPLGNVRPKQSGTGRIINTVAVCLILAIVLINLAAYWRNFVTLNWPIPSEINVWRHLTLVAIWILQVSFVGIFYVHSKKELVVFSALAILGGVQLATVRVLPPIKLIIIAISALSILMIPWLIVKGIIEHVRYKTLLNSISNATEI